MKRWLVNILAGLSLLLCLATAVIWVRSYWVHEYVGWNSTLEELPATAYSLLAESDDGGVLLRFAAVGYPPPGEVDEDSRPYYLEDAEITRGIAGWDYLTTPNNSGGRHGFHMEHYGPYRNWGIVTEYWTLGLPYWLVLGLTAALPALVAIGRWRAAVRDRVGRCAVCGYDLRATPERCPECGRPRA